MVITTTIFVLLENSGDHIFHHSPVALLVYRAAAVSSGWPWPCTSDLHTTSPQTNLAPGKDMGAKLLDQG